MEKIAEVTSLFSASINERGELDIKISAPDDEKSMDLLIKAISVLASQSAKAAFDQTTFICHPGCAFASIIEHAHREFFRTDPEEYNRIVDKGMLTKATAVGTAH